MENTKLAELEAERFLHRAMKYLKSTFPAETQGEEDETLRNELIEACQFAIEHGFESESDVMSLVDLQWRLPRGFESNPETEWVEEILSDSELDNTMKIDALHNAYASYAALKEEE